MHGASEQCMHATEIDRSPGTPSLIVTTRRRLTPHGTSCSFLQAVTQLLHSMQRSASQRNFIRAIASSGNYVVPTWAGIFTLLSHFTVFILHVIPAEAGIFQS